MSDPLVHAFFVGRAIAEAINEKVESAVTTTIGEISKFDAEQRERFRSFSEEVEGRAAQEEQRVAQSVSSPDSAASAASSTDAQELIDDLRSEIARLRAELQRYRSNSD